MFFYPHRIQTRTAASSGLRAMIGLLSVGLTGCGAPATDFQAADRAATVSTAGPSAKAERVAESSSTDSSQSRRPDADLQATRERVSEVVALYQEMRIRPQTPAWIRMHALLMYPPVPGPGRTEDVPQRRALLESLLLAADAGQVPFSLRDKAPIPRKGGELFAREHHPDQILSYLGMIDVPLDQPLRVEGKAFTVYDILRVSQREVRPRQELSWTVAAFAHYGQPGEDWQNRFGERLSLAVLVKALSERAETSCGGTHRLTAIARVVSRRPAEKDDAELSRLRPALRRVLDDETQRLRSGQRPNGVFAVPESLMQQPEATPDAIDLQFTGHSLEWLTLAHGPDVLKSEWVVRAVEALADLLQEAYDGCEDGLLKREILTDADVASQFRVGSAAHAAGALARWLHRMQSAPPDVVAKP